jgi:hypothetical protein
MHSADTSDAADEEQLRVYRRMTPEQRVELAMKLSEDVRAIAREGIRARHPDYSARDIELALLRLLYGDDLIRRAFPSEPLRAA